MRAPFLMLFAFLALIFGGSTAPAPAASPFKTNEIKTINGTHNRVWITIYDVGKTRHADYGWMERGGYRVWTDSQYNGGWDYHVRAEVAALNDISQHPKIIFDTTITIRLNCNDKYNRAGAHVVKLVQSGPNQYHWENLNCADAPR